MSAIDDIIKRAQAKVAAKTQHLVESLESDKKHRAETAKEERQKREKAEREKRNKTAHTIADEFFREISPAIVRLMARADADKLKDVDFIFRPRKTDHSGAYCLQVHSGGAKFSTTHAPGIQEMAASHARLCDKLKAQSKLLFTTTPELMERVIELQDETAKLKAEIAALRKNQKTPDVLAASLEKQYEKGVITEEDYKAGLAAIAPQDVAV